MGRTKGAKNKKSNIQPLNAEMTTEERLTFIANLIADKIRDDQNNGRQLLKKLTE